MSNISYIFQLKLYRFIKTDYTLFLPDGYHMTDPKGLAQMIKKFEESDNDVKILAVGNKHSSKEGPNCEKLVFDFRYLFCFIEGKFLSKQTVSNT